MVHILFDGSEVTLDNFMQAGAGAGISYFEGLPPKYQRGYGYFAGNLRQRDHGLGDVFRSLWRVLRPVAQNIGHVVAPMAKEAGRAIGEEGLAAGARVLNNLVQGDKSVKEALTSEGREGVSRLLDRASNRLRQQKGSGRARRRRKGFQQGAVMLKPGDLVNGRSLMPGMAYNRKRGPPSSWRGGHSSRKRAAGQRVDSLGFY